MKEEEDNDDNGMISLGCRVIASLISLIGELGYAGELEFVLSVGISTEGTGEDKIGSV